MLKTAMIDDLQKRALFFDSANSQFIWKNINSSLEDLPSMLDVPFLQQFYEKNGNNAEVKTPNDVKITKYAPNGKFSKKNTTTRVAHLFKASKQLGLIVNSISNKEIDLLNKNGGLVVSALSQNIENIVLLMPYLKSIEKNIKQSIYKSIVHDNHNEYQSEQQILFTDFDREELLNNKTTNSIDAEKNYYEATIKIPNELVNSNKLDVRRINDTTQRTEKLIQEMNYENKQRFNYLSSQLNKLFEERHHVRDQEEKVRHLEMELMKCHKTIDNLHNDKNILMSENKKSEQIALNNLKSKLDLSRVAIQRQVDLDSFTINETALLNLLLKVLLKANKGKNEIESLLGDEEIMGAVTAISDNFATKVQSLLDIKSNFEELDIIDRRKDV